MSSESNPVNFSGQVHVEIITDGDKKPVIQVSGLRENVAGANIAVSGTNIVTPPAGEANMKVVQGTSFIIGSINANSVNINQGMTTNTISFDHIFSLLEAFPLDDKEELKKLTNEFKESIRTDNSRKSRSILDKLGDLIRKYPKIPELANSGLVIIAACLKLAEKL